MDVGDWELLRTRDLYQANLGDGRGWVSTVSYIVQRDCGMCLVNPMHEVPDGGWNWVKE